MEEFNKDAKELRILSNQIFNDVRKDLYLAYGMGVKKGEANERTKLIKQIKNIFDRYNPSYSDIYNVITELEEQVLEQLKENNNE